MICSLPASTGVLLTEFFLCKAAPKRNPLSPTEPLRGWSDAEEISSFSFLVGGAGVDNFKSSIVDKSSLFARTGGGETAAGGAGGVGIGFCAGAGDAGGVGIGFCDGGAGGGGRDCF
jgi:hypothetical protein